jgi:hypothetical protein
MAGISTTFLPMRAFRARLPLWRRGQPEISTPLQALQSPSNPLADAHSRPNEKPL